MEKVLDFIMSKQFLFVLFPSMCVIEIVRGFLKLFPSYLKSVQMKSYLPFIAAAFFGAFVLMPFDETLIAGVQNIQSEAVGRMILFGAFLGKTHGTWGPLAILYFASLALRSEKMKNIFFGAVLSSALTGLAAHLIKFIALRARPYNDLGPLHFFDWAGFAREHRAFQSFPSGDVAIVSGAAVFLFCAFRRRVFGWVFLILPFLTALSRMDLNKHWPSDTAFSFLAAFTIAKFVRDYFLFSESAKSSAGSVSSFSGKSGTLEKKD